MQAVAASSVVRLHDRGPIRATFNASRYESTALEQVSVPDLAGLEAELEKRFALTEQKDRAPLLIPVADWLERRRRDRNIACFGRIFCADVDGRTPEQIDAIFAALSGVSYIVYSTHSHLADHKDGRECFRFVLELDREWLPSEFEPLWRGVNSLLGGHVDPETYRTKSRGYHIPGCREADQDWAELERQDGHPLSADQLTAIGLRLSPPPKATGFAGAALTAAVVNHFAEGTRQRKNAARQSYSRHARALLAGRCTLQEGERDSTLTAIGGSLARKFRDADPTELARCFEGVGWDQLDDGEFPLLENHGAHESLASKIARFQEAERERWANAIIADPNDPGPTARLFLERHPGVEIVRTGGDFLLHQDTHWRELEREELSSALRDFLEPAVYETKDGEQAPFKPDGAKLDQVARAIGETTFESAGEIPRWRCKEPPVPADEIVSCVNGLLHLPTRELLPHTPDFLNRQALPFSFEPDAPPPARWLEFLGEIFPHDPSAANALQDWFGYVISGSTRLHKIGLFVGPKRSGKGTAARVLAALLGQKNVAGPTLNSLAGDFGLQPLIGKSLAVVSDARLGSRVDQGVVTERLLTLSGGDLLDVPRKNRENWSGYPSARVMILSNELPRLTDTSGALPSRFHLIPFTESFYGREDPGLTDSLIAEAPAILNWCLQGEARLRQRGHLVLPASAQEALEQIEALASPVSVFARESLCVKPGTKAQCKDVYDAWRIWCADQGRDHPGTAATLGRDLRTIVPGIKTRKLRAEESGRRVHVFEGVTLQPETQARLEQSRGPLAQLGKAQANRGAP